MNIFSFIREWIEFKKTLASFYLIDITDAEKLKLDAVDRELLEKIINKAYENILKEGLNNNLSQEYMRGCKHGMFHFLSYFRKYNNINNKK